jgi:hypothetical protein
MQAIEPNGSRGPGPHRLDDLETEFIAPPAPAPEYPLVLVEWLDAWFDLDQSGPEDCRSSYPVRTVGFLVGDGPGFLSVAQEVLPEGEGFRAVTHIPVGIVERVQRLSPRSP